MKKLNQKIFISIPVWKIQERANVNLLRDLTSTELQYVKRSMNLYEPIEKAIEKGTKLFEIKNRNKDAYKEKTHYQVYRKTSFEHARGYKKVFAFLKEKDAREYIATLGTDGDSQFKITKVIKSTEADVITVSQNNYSDADF